MERLIAVAVILQSLELLQIRSAFGVDGIWSWSNLRRDSENLPRWILWVLDQTLRDERFPFLIFSRILFALSILVLPKLTSISFLWITHLLVCGRFRGTFNGGSDYMATVVLTGIFMGRAFSSYGSVWLAVSLGYVGFQLCLSYFVAGVSKLKKPNWRSGRALREFFQSEYYGVPEAIRKRVAGSHSDLFLTALSAGLIAFECFFPAALLSPQACTVFIAIALIFHLGNAWIFGLNRFLWAWGAAYPALFWCSHFWK